MSTGDNNVLTFHREHLRAILVRLDVVREGPGHDDLLKAARDAVANVRNTLAAQQKHSAQP